MKTTKKTISFLLISALITAMPFSAYGAEEAQIKTKIKHTVKAVGEYDNWEGVSNVSQFIGSDGEFWFAYNNKKNITVVSTVDGVVTNKIPLERMHDLFGAVCSDSAGNFYVVTGEENPGNNTDTNTVFISKYDSAGNHITTIGDRGNSSLPDFYEDNFYTKIPFDGGNCDVDVNGDYMAVNYAREMYNGHQSNSIWVINTVSMNTVDFPDYTYEYYEGGYTRHSNSLYSSHSFGQRTVKYGDGFLYAREGDCFSRAFTISQWDLKTNTVSEDDIFHFWLGSGDSCETSHCGNKNYAHMGDLVVLPDGKAAFAATSAPSMTKPAEEENEQVFLQIFDPNGDLTSPSGYVTTGERTGFSANMNGDVEITDYGVKWLTEGKRFAYRNPQMVCAGDKLVVLYEKYAKKKDMFGGIYYKLKGVFYTVLDSSGNVIQESKKFKKSASLNPCEPPVYTKGCIYWAANKSSKKGKLFVYRIKI